MIEKLRSPEKLDTLLPITMPLTWMALSAVVLLLFSVVLWSIFGSFTEKADDLGMIMDSSIFRTYAVARLLKFTFTKVHTYTLVKLLLVLNTLNRMLILKLRGMVPNLQKINAK